MVLKSPLGYVDIKYWDLNVYIIHTNNICYFL